MISSAPFARVLPFARPLASAMAAGDVPYILPKLARVCPRATTWVRNVTRFSGGRFARHSPAGDAAPVGTFTFQARPAGVASRRSSGLSIWICPTSVPAHSATTLRSTASFTGTESKVRSGSGFTSNPYFAGALATTIAAWIMGT